VAVRSLHELAPVSEPATGVRQITLNLPDLRNAMTEALTAAWTDALTDVLHDRDARALVVTGAGSSFCSGADLSWLDQAAAGETTPDRLRDKMLPFYRSWLAVRDLPIPVIAAINGPVIGAGICLAIACDLRYSTPSAKFSTPFIYLGTHGGMGVTSLLPEIIGMPRARDMLYTGREVLAEEALEWGLISGIADDVLGHSVAVAARIASAAPIATRLTKTGLDHSSGRGLEAALEWEALAQPITMNTADLHEGISARRQRRTPEFTGH
jgi:enoyl-CoA hydratase/carnithine racemase